jgi:transglutaminase-like putative cysteine protease
MSVLSVSHVTVYRYNRPISFGPHRMMFRPRDSYDQKLLDATLIITPEPVDLRWLHDPFGNCVTIAEFGDPAQELRFESNIRLICLPTFPTFRSRITLGPIRSRTVRTKYLTSFLRLSANIPIRINKFIAGLADSCGAGMRTIPPSCSSSSAAPSRKTSLTSGGQSLELGIPR